MKKNGKSNGKEEEKKGGELQSVAEANALSSAFMFEKYRSKEGTQVFPDISNEKIAKKEQEVILFVGSPGSGKSTFWNTYLKNYVRVNNDTLKTKEKCMKVLREALQAGKSAVVDNTNLSREHRGRYIPIAKEFKVPVRCFVFKRDKEMCL